jgi:hypothetical protein
MPKSLLPLIVLACGAFPLHSSAQEYTPQVIPMCQEYILAGGVKACGYSLAEWKLVLKADAELVHLRETDVFRRKKAAELSAQVQGLEEALSACGDSTKAIFARSTELSAQLIALDAKYQDEIVKPRWGSALSWAIAGAAISVLAGYIAADQL